MRLRLGIETNYSIITDKGTSFANARHNALRRVIVDMYKVLGEKPMEEPEGLLKAPVNVLKRPADIGLIPSVHGTDLMLALDVSVISPVTSSYIKKRGITFLNLFKQRQQGRSSRSTRTSYGSVPRH